MARKNHVGAAVFIVFLLALSGSAAAVLEAEGVDLRAGEIKETNVSQNFISERWLGISGTVYRGDDYLEDNFLGEIGFSSDQSGEVLSASIEGVKGGGYYLGFMPERVNIQTERISSLEKGSLQKGGLFPESVYPSFYPNYSEYYDNPNKTFEYNQTLRLEGEYYNAGIANLSGDADVYVLEYEHNSSTSYPLLISPIDGKRPGQSFDTCYVSGCNFQALLPVLGDNSSFSYQVYLFSRGQSVRGCGVVDTNSTSLLLGSGYLEQECLEITGTEDLYLDFYNTNMSTDESQPGCAVNITDSKAQIEDLSVEGYKTGACLTDSNVSMRDTEIEDNSLGGVRAEQSNLNLTNVSFGQNVVDVLLRNSNLSAERVKLGDTMIDVEASSIALNERSSELPKPSQAGDDQLPLDLRFQANERAGQSRIDSFGIHYPENLTNEVSDMYVYKYDGDSSPYEVTKLGPLSRSAYVATLEEDITDFSTFELYGVESEQQSNESESGGGGGQQGSGAAPPAESGGSFGGVTDFDPVTEIPELNLTLESSKFDALRGETVSIDFSLNNTGNVSLNDVEAAVTNSSFPAVPRRFDSVNVREVRQGRILLSVPEDAEPRNRTFEVAATYRNLTLDSELVKLNISELRQVKDVDLVESPSFVNFKPGKSRSVGFLLENPTNRDLKGIKAEIRGEGNCVTLPDRNFSLSSGERKNVQLQFQTSNTTEVCNSVVVFRHQGDILGYSPMRIVVERQEDQQELPIPLYLILLVIWTTVLGYRVINNRR